MRYGDLPNYGLIPVDFRFSAFLGYSSMIFLGKISIMSPNFKL